MSEEIRLREKYPDLFRMKDILDSIFLWEDLPGGDEEGELFQLAEDLFGKGFESDIDTMLHLLHAGFDLLSKIKSEVGIKIYWSRRAEMPDLGASLIRKRAGRLVS